MSAPRAREGSPPLKNSMADSKDRYPTLHAIGLGPQLEAMERVALLGQRGKHRGQLPVEKSADYHFTKADGHMCQSGPEYGAEDEDDTGERHLVLAALRLLMADACVQVGRTTDE